MKSARWLQLRDASCQKRGLVYYAGVALGSESFMSAFSWALSKSLVQSHRVVTFFAMKGIRHSVRVDRFFILFYIRSVVSDVIWILYVCSVHNADAKMPLAIYY